MPNYIIKETTEYYPLSVLFHDNGVGVPITEETPDEMIKMWKMEDIETGKLLAAVTFQKRAGVYALGSIAVSPDCRGMGYGTIMQQTLFNEAKSLGISQVWACARVPDYYLKCGWEIMDWDSSPKVDVNCPTCEKLGKTCTPSIVCKKL